MEKFIIIGVSLVLAFVVRQFLIKIDMIRFNENNPFILDLISIITIISVFIMSALMLQYFFKSFF